MSRDWTNLDWQEKTWGERGLTILAWALACILGFAIFVGGVIVIGESLDGVARYKSDRDWCLKHATNGYDIKQCD